jgi:hypothetical protein
MYISREKYTKEDVGNVIILDEEGIPNVVNINAINASMDEKLNAIKKALEGGKIPFTLVEAHPDAERPPNRRCPNGTVAGNFFGRNTCVYAKWGWAENGYNFNPK